MVKRRRSSVWCVGAVSLFLVACGGSNGNVDPGDAASEDGGEDGGSDGPTEMDAGPDGATDGGDGGTEADAGEDAGDAGPDAAEAEAGAPCPDDCLEALCLDDGTCGECAESVPCDGDLKCEPTSQTCVECLPEADDCPTGMRCDGATFACVDGCKPADCPDGTCNESHECVDCTADSPCQDSSLQCELTTQTCVECLPTDDECPEGSYCTEQYECAPGCKDDSSCASGRCDEDTRECDSCLDDLECGADRVCGTFVCGPTCGNAGDPACLEGTECCGDQCVDTARDIEHCGGCEIACSEDQFCGTDAGTVGCLDVELGNVCKFETAALVLTGQSGDAEQSGYLADALENLCAPAPDVRTVNQEAASVLNPTTGQPVAGGNDLLVILGSNYMNNLVTYIEEEDIAPVYLAVVANQESFELRRSSNDEVLLSEATADETEDHAHFLVQLARDPASGTLILSAYGFWQEGTAAARRFLENSVLPDLASFTDAWYIYEWTSGDDDEPGTGDDTYDLVESGT